MATRKFMFMAAEGFMEEAATTDDTALGGLAMSGAITMGTNKITGLGAGAADNDALAFGQSGANLAGLTIDTADLVMTSRKITGLADGSASGDGVNKGQLDAAVIQGGTMKEFLLHEDQLDNAEGVLAAVALTMAVNPVAGDLVTLTDGTTTRAYGATSGGDVQYTIGGTVAITMQNLADAIVADASSIWGAVFTTDLDAIDTDGVVVIYEDDNDGTASKVYGVWATQADCDVVDFGGELNYEKKTLSDMPATEPGTTNFGMRRTQASLEPGELHYVDNNDVIYGWDSDASVWNAMSGGTSIPDATSASGGGVKGKVTFDSDKGLSVTSGVAEVTLAAAGPLEFISGDVTVNLEASNPSLAVVSTELGLKIDASGGLQKGASGSGIKLDDTPDTLDVDSDGLKVVGLPSLFKINDVAVGATVTAANQDTLTDGSNADALHTHTGTAESTRIENDYVAAVNLAAGDPTYHDAKNNRVDKGDCATVAKSWVNGVARTAITAAAIGPIVSVGLALAAITGLGFTAGNRLYLASGGGLTVTRPVGSGNRVVVVGFAKNATDLDVAIRDYGRAA